MFFNVILLMQAQSPKSKSKYPSVAVFGVMKALRDAPTLTHSFVKTFSAPYEPAGCEAEDEYIAGSICRNEEG